jgi:methylenetetrahydrofolate reductase (NADPH)
MPLTQNYPNKVSVQSFVRDYSIETTFLQAKRIERFADIVASGTRIYIPQTPRSDFQDTIALAVRLRSEGMEPVPHIVARRIESLAILDDFLARLAGNAGVRQVLIVAGDTARPAGQLHSALQILESDLLEKYRVRTVGVTGHPEGHPEVNDAVLGDALKRKNAYADRTSARVYIVTQFTFSADPVIAWEGSHGADIGRLPVTVGLPGLATARTLLRYAMDCGVGASLEAFSKRYASLTKLLTISAPDETIVALAGYKERTSQTRLTGVHFFTFGGFEKTAKWANQIVEGNFEVTEHGGLVLT